MDISNKKVLVTGADGFIGSHLTEALLNECGSVRAFVLYNSFNSWGWLDHCGPEVKNAIDVFPADIRDPFAVKKALEGIDVVFHLAAVISIPYSYVAPMTNFETNALGTINVLQAATELGMSKVVHTSTSEVYGSARFVPITEEHPLQGQSPYSASKIAADQAALSFYSSFNTPVTIVRPFNTYGPRQSARAVIPTIISQLRAGVSELKLGSLHPTRDLSYVSDTVAGFIAAARSDCSTGEFINLGSNFEIAIKDLASVIIELMGSSVDIVADDERIRPDNSEVERLWADNSKAAALLGWTPEYGGIEGMKRGLSQTIEWFSDPKNLALYKTERYNI